MTKKTIVLGEKTRVLFNEVKGIFINMYPEIPRVTDDYFIFSVLKAYRGVTDGKRKTRT